jgi:hypothetical protein
VKASHGPATTNLVLAVGWALSAIPHAGEWSIIVGDAGEVCLTRQPDHSVTVESVTLFPPEWMPRVEHLTRQEVA